MTYTFTPEEKHAKAYGRSMRISTKSAAVLCRVIRGKKLTVAKRLLGDLLEQRRSLAGKYYTKTVRHMLELVESCEKNAEFLGLDSERLFVHASAHQGPSVRRRRRKAAFGSRLKSTHVEIMLVEKGRSEKVPKTKMKTKTEIAKQAEKERAEIKAGLEEVKEKTEKLKVATKEKSKVEA